MTPKEKAMAKVYCKDCHWMKLDLEYADEYCDYYDNTYNEYTEQLIRWRTDKQIDMSENNKGDCKHFQPSLWYRLKMFLHQFRLGGKK